MMMTTSTVSATAAAAATSTKTRKTLVDWHRQFQVVFLSLFTLLAIARTYLLVACLDLYIHNIKSAFVIDIFSRFFSAAFVCFSFFFSIFGCRLVSSVASVGSIFSSTWDDPSSAEFILFIERNRNRARLSITQTFSTKMKFGWIHLYFFRSCLRFDSSFRRFFLTLCASKPIDCYEWANIETPQISFRFVRSFRVFFFCLSYLFFCFWLFANEIPSD